VLAVTDHDTTAGCGAAALAGRDVDLQVIPAIEVSSTYHGSDIHVLGYFVDPDARPLREHERTALDRREVRMQEMLDRLRSLGRPLDFEQVEAVAGPDRVALGRPHLAEALVRAGHVTSIAQAFDTLIGDGGPAFVPTPPFALRLALAERATLLTDGQRVDPRRTRERGFQFEHPDLEPALADLVATPGPPRNVLTSGSPG